MRWSVCFIGGARYSCPLNPTAREKFRILDALGRMFVIGFSLDGRARLFREYGRFYLLPSVGPAILRHVLMLSAGALLAAWCVFRHGVRILVAQSPYEGVAAAWAKVLAGFLGHRVALVIENHGDFESSPFLDRRVPPPGWRRRLAPCLARFSLRHAEALRAVSGFTRDQLRRWSRGRRIVQFPAWTDLRLFLEAGNLRREREGVRILFAGRVVPGKGVHHLVASFGRIRPRFPQSELVIVGREADADYGRSLRSLARQGGVEDRVRFAAECSQADLAAWMAGASLFVLPSLSEGLGLVVVEAMAAGLPVVASRVGGIPEMVEDGITGLLVPPGDEEALARGMAWMLDHPSDAEEMVRRGRAFASGFTTASAYRDGYGALFDAAMGTLRESGVRACGFSS